MQDIFGLSHLVTVIQMFFDELHGFGGFQGRRRVIIGIQMGLSWEPSGTK